MPNSPTQDGREQKKSRKLAVLVGNLLSYTTVAEAAKATGICARTATRWMKSPKFAELYAQARQGTLEGAANLLRQSSTGSIETLAAISRDPNAPPTARVAAAGRILDVLIRITEAWELERRIVELEKGVQVTGKDGTPLTVQLLDSFVEGK